MALALGLWPILIGRAGVEDGDVIVEFNGKNVTDPRSLQLLVAQAPPGSKVTLRVLRGATGNRTSEKTLSATLAELPQETFATGRGGSSSEDGKQQPPTPWRGLRWPTWTPRPKVCRRGAGDTWGQTSHGLSSDRGTSRR